MTTTMVVMAQAALLLFNTEVTGRLALVENPPRVFLGAQLNEDTSAISWTKCVPESGVLVVHLSVQAADMDPVLIKHAAMHEVCHTLLYRKALCEMASVEMPQWARDHQKRHMEVEVGKCVVDMQARQVVR